MKKPMAMTLAPTAIHARSKSRIEEVVEDRFSAFKTEYHAYRQQRGAHWHHYPTAKKPEDRVQFLMFTMVRPDLPPKEES